MLLAMGDVRFLSSDVPLTTSVKRRESRYDCIHGCVTLAMRTTKKFNIALLSYKAMPCARAPLA